MKAANPIPFPSGTRSYSLWFHKARWCGRVTWNPKFIEIWFSCNLQDFQVIEASTASMHFPLTFLQVSSIISRIFCFYYQFPSFVVCTNLVVQGTEIDRGHLGGRKYQNSGGLGWSMGDVCPIPRRIDWKPIKSINWQFLVVAKFVSCKELLQNCSRNMQMSWSWSNLIGTLEFTCKKPFKIA